MITIGQLARYAGVTIKAVRHYHQRGLLDEPPRDSCGYRRYTAADALKLVKIRTLAQAGVPLVRIKDLLTADPDQFTAAVADIDRSLRERADAIRDARLRLAQLTAGDEAFVPTQVARYLDRLRELDVSGRAIQMERDGWILVHSASPAQAAVWIADKLTAIHDPEFTAIYLEYDAAFDWPPDDPRLPALAERTQRWLADRSSRPTGQTPNPTDPAIVDPAIVDLATTLAGPSSPAWDRLSELARQHHADRHTAQRRPKPHDAPTRVRRPRPSAAG